MLAVRIGGVVSDPTVSPALPGSSRKATMRQGGSDWLDALLYDESPDRGSHADDLWDLVHLEIMRLRFDDLRRSSDGEAIA
jgi:hypothetical protein